MADNERMPEGEPIVSDIMPEGDGFLYGIVEKHYTEENHGEKCGYYPVGDETDFISIIVDNFTKALSDPNLKAGDSIIFEVL